MRSGFFCTSCPGEPGAIFEVFVTAEENWLPPDNFQEKPADGVASRTSPTNIGMALLADLAAYDFGYCCAGRLLDRTRKTFGTLARMERYRGHFYNWYDTRSLKPLLPLYVSTVDSGNLAGHLLVLRSGLLELIDTKLLPPRIFRRPARHGARSAGRGPWTSPDGRGRPRTAGASVDVLHKIRATRQRSGESTRHARAAAATFLQRLVTAAAEIAAAVGTDEELRWWASAFERSCTDHRDDLLHIAAWLSLAPPSEQLQRARRVSRDFRLRLDAVPSLREVAALQQSMLPVD